MKTLLAIPIMILGALVSHNTASAQTTVTPLNGAGVLQLAWGNPDSFFVHQAWSGPTPYSAIVTVSQAESTHAGYALKFRLSAGALPLPDAWRFDSEGCQSGLLSISPAAVSKACPAFGGESQLNLSDTQYDTQGGTLSIAFSLVYAATTPAPAQRYTLCKLTFDHTYSDLGVTVSGESCGGAGSTLLLEVTEASLLCASGETIPLVILE